MRDFAQNWLFFFEKKFNYLSLGFANVRVFFLNPSSEYEFFSKSEFRVRPEYFRFLLLKKKKTTQKNFYLQFSLYQFKKRSPSIQISPNCS